MKKVVLLVALFAAAAGLAGANPFALAKFEKTYPGSKLSDPVDVAKLKSAINASLANHGWLIGKDDGQSIEAMYAKGDDDSVSATVRIRYGADGYSVEYLDSKGLGADLKAMKIHKNYVRWVKNLIKDIGVRYY